MVGYEYMYIKPELQKRHWELCLLGPGVVRETRVNYEWPSCVQLGGRCNKKIMMGRCANEEMPEREEHEVGSLDLRIGRALRSCELTLSLETFCKIKRLFHTPIHITIYNIPTPAFAPT